MSSELNIWFWNVRFLQALQEEEFRVRVSPAGQITGYEHKIEESRSGRHWTAPPRNPPHRTFSARDSDST